MPISYQIEPALSRIVVTLTDPFEISQIETYHAHVFADPQFISGFDLLADMRIKHYNMSSIMLRGQAARAGQLKNRFSGRQALVCHENRLIYGMARLYEIFSKPFGLEVKVFTKVTEAEHWLDECQRRALEKTITEKTS